jgi:hypothetical protein
MDLLASAFALESFTVNLSDAVRFNEDAGFCDPASHWFYCDLAVTGRKRE